MDKWKLSETEDEPADDGPFPFVWSQSEEEAYNKYVGKPFHISPIIPNAACNIERRGAEANRSIWSRMFVLVKQGFEALRSLYATKD